MDYYRGNGSPGDVVKFQSGNSGNGINDNRSLGKIDEAIWVAEDGTCNKGTSAPTNSKPNHKGRPFQFEVGIEPPNKRGKRTLLEDFSASDNLEARKMFYKTKICKKFQAGACPYIMNCNFAHGMEELRELPPNWKDIVAAHKEEMELSKPRVQVPFGGHHEVRQGIDVSHLCRDFISEFGCQYGENCNFIHDGNYKDRTSEIICLLPGTAGGSLRTPYWKTRICNNWESDGFCVYGRNCQFAHGFAELRRYDGELVKGQSKDFRTSAQASVSAADMPAPLVPYSYHVGGPSRSLPNAMPKPGEMPTRRWKGPNKISKIYGDWIDDL